MTQVFYPKQIVRIAYAHRTGYGVIVGQADNYSHAYVIKVRALDDGRAIFVLQPASRLTLVSDRLREREA